MTQTLDQQRIDFAKRSFIATPLSGLIIWTLIGISGLFFPDSVSVWAIFIGTGSIVYLALFVSKFTGENFLDKSRPKNEFDTLFFVGAGQAILVYSIAIPFFMMDYTSLPMTVGILTGLMWLPFSWIIKHWVGFFHTLSRTIIVLVLWYVFPDYRFTTIPFAIVALYLITLFILSKRSGEIVR